MTEGMVVASHSARALRRIAWRPRVSPLLRVHRLGDCRNCPSIGSRTFGPFLAAVDVFDLTPSVTGRALTLASPRRLSPLAAGPQTDGRSLRSYPRFSHLALSGMVEIRPDRVPRGGSQAITILRLDQQPTMIVKSYLRLAPNELKIVALSGEESAASSAW